MLPLAVLAVGCGDDAQPQGPGRERDAGTDTRPRPTNDTTPDDTDQGQADTDDSGGNGQPDASVDPDGTSPGDTAPPPIDTSPPDSTPSPDTGPDPCDQDGDGYRAVSCGGDDCDDTNPAISPGARELCDDLDNDCDGVANNGIECWVYAHTSQELFRVDPFLRVATSVPTGRLPGLFDFDVDPRSGTLYGITSNTLYRLDDATTAWVRVNDFAGVFGTANGLAINSAGEAFVTASNDVYRLDLTSGSATRIGSMGGGFNSSGDCVVDKSDTLYMSSSHTSPDSLIRIEISGTSVTATNIGSIGFRNVYGLTAAWGRMYGFASGGEVIEIDQSTGRGTLLFDPGHIWYGAASSTTR